MEKFLNLFKVYRSQFTQTAFTLAETLIVIGILGVVAALTLPNLNHATGDKETITKVKKIYSALTEAFDRAQAVYGPMAEWPTSDGFYLLSSTVGNRISEFMKVSKNCETKAKQGCFSSEYAKHTSGTTFIKPDESFVGVDPVQAYRFITADGMSVALVQFGVTTQYSILVDIDGPNKGSNTFGKDLFYFTTDSRTIEVKPGGYSSTPDFATLISNLYTSGYEAAQWIVKYDNMDYLKFKDSSGTCDNGNVVTESNPSCN